LTSTGRPAIGEALAVIREQGFFGSLYRKNAGGQAWVSNYGHSDRGVRRVCANSAFIVATQGLSSMPLILASADEQKAKYLRLASAICWPPSR
jgi:alkylation response protein AidB-like acyl-CoA dehydrogenase